MPNHLNRTIRILIVDDHPIVRCGYEQLLGNQSDMEVCGTAETEKEALQAAIDCNPDLAIVDISLKDSSGLELIKHFQKSHSNLKLLVISAHDENVYAERVLQAGALGYINKQEATELLVTAVRQVINGEVFVSQQIAKRLLMRRVGKKDENTQCSGPVDLLSDREIQVFEMIGTGNSSKQIAAKLHLSVKTIERYKENIKRNLMIKNSTELVQRATQWILEKS
jgi:DNA-binding NarL/FixJ family response regulator